MIIAIKDPSSSKNGCGTWVRWKCWKLSSQPKKICWYLSGSTKKFILCQRKICEWCDPQKKDHSSLNLLSIYFHPSAVTLLLLCTFKRQPPHLLSSLPLQLKSLFCVKEEINERMGKFWTWDRFSICYMNAPGICWHSFSRNVLRRTATNVSIKSKWKEEWVTIFWKKGSNVFEMNLQMSEPFVSFAFIYFLVKHALSPLPLFILCC